MTTDIQVTVASNLFKENDVMNFKQAERECIPLSGVSWLVEGFPPAVALRSTLQLAIGSIRKKLPGYNIWLAIGSAAWQPNTRVVRYYKLWGALKAQGVDVPMGDLVYDTMIEAKEGLKFFGATLLSGSYVEDIADVLLAERCAYIIAMPDVTTPQEVLEIGWSGHLDEDFNLIFYLNNVQGVLLKRVGDFDDREWGTLALINPSLLDTLLE